MEVSSIGTETDRREVEVAINFDVDSNLVMNCFGQLHYNGTTPNRYQFKNKVSYKQQQFI